MPFIFSSFAQQNPPGYSQIHLPAAEEYCRQTLNDLYPGSDEVSRAYTAFAEPLHDAYVNGQIAAQGLLKIYQAIQFAAKKHLGQTRKNEGQSPYIIHPIGVARRILTVGQVADADILIAALLHDTVEDTGASFEEIEREFGAAAAGYVREVTDDKSLPKEVRKDLQIEHAPHKSPGAAMIKLADKHYNLSDLLRETPVEWTEERVSAYFEWAKKVVDALPDANPALKKAVDDVIAARG